jgi:hypothetical protein
MTSPLLSARRLGWVGDYRHRVLLITKLRALGFEPAVSLTE